MSDFTATELQKIAEKCGWESDGAFRTTYYSSNQIAFDGFDFTKAGLWDLVERYNLQPIGWEGQRAVKWISDKGAMFTKEYPTLK